MGDRANCIVHQNSFENKEPPVWLYTHWGGCDLLSDVQKAIKRRQRWDDDSYLTRIIFDAMTNGKQGKVTGAGITTRMTDNEHDFIIVDPGKQEVRIEDPETREVKHQWSMDRFCELDISEITY